MYNTVAALLFVTDRFSYWQGSSHTTLQLVEYLQTNSPGTAIAPQLLIRKVRVMKNAGDLHGIYKYTCDSVYQFCVNSRSIICMHALIITTYSWNQYLQNIHKLLGIINNHLLVLHVVYFLDHLWLLALTGILRQLNLKFCYKRISYKLFVYKENRIAL